MQPESKEDRIARLEARLQDGFTKIGDAMSRGVEVDNWERHWIELLREYETLEDEIAAHHAETVPAQGRLLDAPVAREEVLV